MTDSNKTPSLDELLDSTYTPPKKTKRVTQATQHTPEGDHLPVVTLYQLSKPVSNTFLTTEWRCRCGNSGMSAPQLGSVWHAPGHIRLWKANHTPLSGLPFTTDTTTETVELCPQCANTNYEGTPDTHEEYPVEGCSYLR